MPARRDALTKVPTGIKGLDEITVGGLPKGRPTLICGGPGSGKTLFGMEFLVRGALSWGEPGVCISFEESGEDLAQNVRSLGFDVNALIAAGKLFIDHVKIDRHMIEETGEYDLEALFIRIGHAIDSIGAKRILLDTMESLFSGIPNEGVLRSELRRLFQFLKDRKLTAVVTAERGDGPLTRNGMEEYISDCVILLDHRANDWIVTRRLRVVKYRGSTHGTNEYPFLIDDEGFSILPITSISLSQSGSQERISSGVPGLDEMLDGKGYFRGTSILVSGTPGTGKTSLASHFAHAACKRGERCLYLAFEESSDQLVRNMKSIGLNLGRWIDKGLLLHNGSRPTTLGLEQHLVVVHKLVKDFEPAIVIVDPVSSLLGAGSQEDASHMVIRLIDFLKNERITTLMTSLTQEAENQERGELQISSLMDTWILLRDIELNGERNRGIYVLKSRGMSHSNQIREFLLSEQGVHLRDVYVGPAGLYTGSSRVAQEAEDRRAELLRAQDTERRRLAFARKRDMIEAQIAALQVELESESLEMELLGTQEQEWRSRAQNLDETLKSSRRVKPQPEREEASGNRNRIGKAALKPGSPKKTQPEAQDE